MNISPRHARRDRLVSWMPALLAAMLALPALAQTPPANLLRNGGFETLASAPPTVCGNNYATPTWPAGGYPISPWVTIGTASANVVTVDGNVNCHYGNSGPATDAEGTPAGTLQHYLDLLDDGSVYQSFTVPACPGSAAPRTVQYAGAFSGRDMASLGAGTIKIVQGAGATGTVMATQSTSGASYQAWTTLSGTVALTPGDYTYISEFSNPTNFDNAVVTLTPCAAPAGNATAVPVDSPWALMALTGVLGWLGRRAIKARRR